MERADNKPKILVIDIETTPLVAYSWGPQHDTNLIEVIDDSHLLSYSAKWLQGKQITEGTNNQSEYKLLLSIKELLDEADVVIGHNSISFDMKVITAGFLRYEIPPPSPFKQIDTLKECRKIMKVPSYGLDNLSYYLDIGEKLKHEGFSLWKRCMVGDVNAWKKMLRYNAQDVRLTEKLYLKIRPYIKTHPHLGKILEKEVCPKCGSKHLQSRGYAKTVANVYRRAQCQECGSWCRFATSERRYKTTRNI